MNPCPECGETPDSPTWYRHRACKVQRFCDCGQPAGIAAAVDDVYAGHTAGCSIRPKKRVHRGTLQEQLRSWARNRRNYRHLHLGADLLDRAADRIDELEMRLKLLQPDSAGSSSRRDTRRARL